MDISKRKVRFSLERLEKREVPAQIVELPYAAAPVAEVALTAPADLGQGGGTAPTSDPGSELHVSPQDVSIAWMMNVHKASPKL
jgi:hypothetical protein